MNEKFDRQKLKELRTRLLIPIKYALELLEANEGDLEKSEIEFHRNNINTICRLAECEEVLAEKYYHICASNVDKAIEKIHERLCFLTAHPEEPIDKIGFILWTRNDSISQYVTSRDRSLFIQSRDFEYVIDVFRSVYPIINPENGMVENNFDIVSNNIFDNKTCRIIVDRMARLSVKDQNIEIFLRALIKWFNVRLRFADYIVVYGNL